MTTDLPESFDVLCVGNAIVDVISHADDALLAEHGMVKGTMALVEADRALAIYGAMGPGIESSGGSAANTAAGIASFGGHVAFIGKVAGDQLGQVFTHDIRSAGVHFDAPDPGDSDESTARCMVLVTPDAQRTMNTFLGISSYLSPRDVPEALAQRAAVTYCEGYLWDQPVAKEAIRKAMDTAKAAGHRVAFTLSDPFCVDRHRAEFLELAEHSVDILFANESEICSLYETDHWDTAVAKVAGHCEIACLTRSELGSMIVTGDGQRITVPAHPVDAVVDTTGAGDLYAAGFLYGFTNDFGLEPAGRLGALAAGEVIGHLGARPEVSLADLAKSL